MTYGDRPDFWPASSGYFLAPYARGVAQRLTEHSIPPELWGDLPGLPAYPEPREYSEAGAPEFGSSDPGVIDPTLYRVPGLIVGGRTVLPPMVITPEGPLPGYPGGGSSPGIMPYTPPKGTVVVPTTPPPTTIPEVPSEKKAIHPGWIVGGVALGLVAVGSIVYLATKSPKRRNPRRRRRKNPSRRRRARARARNPYAADAQGVIHYFPEERSRTRWLKRAPSKKSHRVKGSTRRVRKAKKRGAVVQHRKNSRPQKKRRNARQRNARGRFVKTTKKRRNVRARKR